MGSWWGVRALSSPNWEHEAEADALFLFAFLPFWNPQSGCFCQGGAPHGDTVDIRAILNPPKPLFTCHHRARNSFEIPKALGRNFSCFKC